MDITIPATITVPAHIGQMPDQQIDTPMGGKRTIKGDQITIPGSTVDGTITLHVSDADVALVKAALTPAPVVQASAPPAQPISTTQVPTTNIS